VRDQLWVTDDVHYTVQKILTFKPVFLSTTKENYQNLNLNQAIFIGICMQTIRYLFWNFY